MKSYYRVSEGQHYEKEILAVVMVALMFGMLSMQAAAAENLNEEKLRESYWDSPVFQAHYAVDPEGALAMLEDVVADYAAVQSSVSQRIMTSDEMCAYVNASTVMQQTSYGCGPASAYIAITGWGGGSSVSGSTINERLETLADNMETNSADGTNVYKMRNELNSYISTYEYRYIEGRDINQVQFENYVFISLYRNRAPILHARTAPISYYNGNNYKHYIPITKIDYNTMQIRVQDPHYDYDYYGTHMISFEEAFNSINEYDDRYLIYHYD